MTTGGIALRVVGGILLALAAGLAVLLIYYRPTIEYAYVDIVDLRKENSGKWITPALGLAGLLIAGGVAWRIASRRRG